MAHANQPTDDVMSNSGGVEKTLVADIQHRENESDLTHMDTHHQELARDGYLLDTDELPKGYYWSSKFLGTFFGIGMNLMGSTVSKFLVTSYSQESQC